MTFLYYFFNGAAMAFFPQFMQLAVEGKWESVDQVSSINWIILIGFAILGGFREWRNRMATPPPQDLTEEQINTIQQLQLNMSQRNQQEKS